MLVGLSLLKQSSTKVAFGPMDCAGAQGGHIRRGLLDTTKAIGGVRATKDVAWPSFSVAMVERYFLRYAR